MISCAYALLFLNSEASSLPSSSGYSSYQVNIYPKGVHYLQSLVLLGDGKMKSFYGTYEFPINGQFPMPDPNSDIVKTNDSDYEPDTKVAAYCSPTLSSMEIIKKIEKGLTLMTNKYYAKKKVMTDSENKCFELIQTDMLKELDNRSKAKILAQNNQCSSRDIISLAHRGFLSVAGVYSSLAPTYENKDAGNFMRSMGFSLPGNNIPKVNIMNGVNLKDLISGKHILGVCKSGEKNIALAWYFGHLHLFQRDSEKNLWWPKTIINLDMRNGALILRFMRSCLNLFHQLDAKIQEYGLLDITKDYVTCSHCFGISTEEKYKRIMAEIGDLTIEKGRIPDRFDLSWIF